MSPFIVALAAIIIAAGHWFSDFVMQTDYMAVNKSHSNKALLSHVLIQTVFMGWAVAFALFFLLGKYVIPLSIFFLFYNFVLHACIDWVTSKWAKYHFDRGDKHNGFVVIGFDQLLHAVTYIFFIAKAYADFS